MLPAWEVVRGACVTRAGLLSPHTSDHLPASLPASQRAQAAAVEAALGAQDLLAPPVAAGERGMRGTKDMSTSGGEDDEQDASVVVNAVGQHLGVGWEE